MCDLLYLPASFLSNTLVLIICVLSCMRVRSCVLATASTGELAPSVQRWAFVQPRESHHRGAAGGPLPGKLPLLLLSLLFVVLFIGAHGCVCFVTRVGAVGNSFTRQRLVGDGDRLASHATVFSPIRLLLGRCSCWWYFYGSHRPH